MPRSNRILPTDLPMHIMARGNNKLAILTNDNDKKEYYYLLHKLKLDNLINILHYCFMDNHIHLIVWLNKNSNLPRFMKQTNLSYYHYYRKEYGYCGHLWQSKYKSVIVQTDRQALACGKYIELNPVRAGIVQSPEQYEFSSYKYYAFGQPDALITPNPAFLGLDANISTSRKIYANFIQAKKPTNEKGDRSL